MKKHMLRILIPILRILLRPSSPIKNKAFRFVARHYLWRKDITVIAKTKFGFSVNATPAEFQEGRLMFFGFWEPTVTTHFTQTLQSDSIVIDLGANLGYFTLLASKLTEQGGHVYSVEPSHSNRDRLESNLKLNEIRNVTVLPYGAWNSEKQAELFTESSGSGTASLHPPDGHIIKRENVELRAMTDVIPLQHHSRVKLIKIDCEGAELRALQGLSSILASSPEVEIICEMNPLVIKKMGGSSDDIFSLLEKHKIHPVARLDNDISPKGFLTPDWRASVPFDGDNAKAGYVLFKKRK